MDSFVIIKKNDMETKETKKAAKWYFIALGIILTPVLFITFIIDRFLMVFLVMGHAPDLVEYYQDLKYVGVSILRTVAVAVLTTFIWWLCR